MPVTPYATRHAASVPTASAAVSAAAPKPDDTGGDTPGASAGPARLRLHPRHVRFTAMGVLGVGVALFVATSVASAATSHSHHDVTAAARPRVTSVTPIRPAAPAAAQEAAAGPNVAAAQPVRTPKKATTSKKVISGLAANGIPNVALNAYRVAALRMKSAQPSCGIDWALLAGIGREESDHGQFHGAVLHPDGTSTPRIIGPALNGDGNQFIAAPPNGYALDGDSLYTHALGPMQFIPQTWATYGVDANGNGKKDVFNINDAALGAARYLCAAGGNLRTESGQVRAVRAYNHDDTYVAQVLALAAAYRAGVPITGLPVGQLTGALPPVVPGSLLGVNPGVPTAHGATGAVARTASSTPHLITGRSRSSSGSRTSGGSTRPSSAPSQPHSAPSSSAPPKSGPSPAPTSPSSSPAPKSPAPTPTPTCRVVVGGVCVVH